MTTFYVHCNCIWISQNVYRH